MNNRINLLNCIKKNIDSGKVNIIFLPRDVDSKKFILNELKPFLEDNYPGCISSYLPSYSNENNLQIFNTINASNNKFFLFINDISQYRDPLSIIGTFYGNSKINVIATTRRALNHFSRNNGSDIRGRYISYFYPPYLYGDFSNEYSSNIRKLLDLYCFDYKYKDILEKTYLYILYHIGEILSLRILYRECATSVSLVTFIKIIDYMNDSGLIYKLPRVLLNDFELGEYGFAIYPTHCRVILSKELKLDDSIRIKNYFDSMIVARAFYDNQIIYRALYLSKKTFDEAKTHVGLNNCFLIKNKSSSIILKTNYFDDDISLKKFIYYKGNIQKILASYNESDSFLAENGMIKCGIKYLLKNGIFSYANI